MSMGHDILHFNSDYVSSLINYLIVFHLTIHVLNETA